MDVSGFDGGMMTTFDEQYPNLAWWVQDGWIEIGQDEHSDSFIRVLDAGGLVWESNISHETVVEALAEADREIGHREDEAERLAIYQTMITVSSSGISAAFPNPALPTAATLVEGLQYLFRGLFKVGNPILPTLTPDTRDDKQVWDSRATLSIKLVCNYGYEIASGESDSLWSDIPLLFLPYYDFKLASDWNASNPDSFVTYLANRVKDKKTEMGIVTNGRILFDIDVFDPRAVNLNPRPLLKLEKSYYDESSKNQGQVLIGSLITF